MTDLLEETQPSSAPDRRRSPGPAPGPGARGFRPDVEGLRAVAIVSVVLYHAALGIRGGYVGVDVFFVISGFLITGQLLSTVGTRGLSALPGFYARRIRRLLPAATVVVIATLVAVRAWAPVLQMRDVMIDGIFTTFYGINYRLAGVGTDYMHQNDAVSPLQHFWSLAVEEQFYVVWPLLILLSVWLGRRHRRAALGIALVAIVAVTLMFSVNETNSSSPWAYFSLHTRAWELGLGALVALGAARLARLPRVVAEAGAIAGLLAIVASAVLYTNGTPYPGIAAALPVVGTALVIASGCGAARRAERILGHPVAQGIGRVSYGWYLWHWPMLIVAPYALGHSLSVAERLAVVGVSFGAAVIMYFAVENPVRHLVRRTSLSLGLGLALSGSTAAAGVVLLSVLPSTVGTGDAVAVAAPPILTAPPAVAATDPPSRPASPSTSTTISPAQRAQRQREAAAHAQALIEQQYRQAIAAGVKVKAAPRNLVPKPEKANDDVPAADHNGCFVDFKPTAVPPASTCTWGNPAGAKTVVLFGDSHVDQWLPAFDTAGKATGWRVVDWSKGSCPAGEMTVYSKVLKRNYTECDRWRTAAVAAVVKLKPDLVVVSSLESTAPDHSAAEYAAATVRTLRELKAAGAPVVFLQDIPAPHKYQAPLCVADHLDDVRTCTFTPAAGYSFPERHPLVASRVAKAGFRVVEPAPWICTAQRCPVIVGNMLVFRDDTHITTEFSTYLASRVAPLLTGG